jgi:hypothetical protein
MAAFLRVYAGAEAEKHTPRLKPISSMDGI